MASPAALGLLGGHVHALPPRALAIAADIELTTDRTRYTAGESVVVTLTNHSSTPMWYNTCPRELQSQELEGWVTVSARPTEGTDCIAVAYHLAPGASVDDVTPLDRALAPGRYRLRFAWVSNGAATEPFRVMQRPSSEEQSR